MFWKISSAAADAHSFSSLASPPNGKLSSLFTRPPKPTPLTFRNSRSLFTIPAEMASACPNSSFYEPKIGVSMARLEKFLRINCKSGCVSADEAFGFFHRMVQMEPRFGLYSFNLLLNGLAKNKRYSDVVLLYGKMNSVGMTPNFITLSILLNCSCNANRVCDAFLVMGIIIRKGCWPNIVTFNSLIKGLCIGSRVADAFQLFLRLEKFGCRPNVNTCNTLISGLCESGNTSKALRLFEEMISGIGQYGVRCEPNVVSYSSIIDGLCKEGREGTAMKLFLEMQAQGFTPNSFVYKSLMDVLRCAGRWYDAQSLFVEMMDRGIQPDLVTFHIMTDALYRAGYMEEVFWIIRRMKEMLRKEGDTW